MKKILFLAAIATAFVSTSTFAQKINTKSILGDIEDSNEDIASAKKAAKYSTWVDRGEVFFEAEQAISKSIYAGMDQTLMAAALGKANGSKQAEVNGRKVTINKYPYLDAYIADGKLIGWTYNKRVVENAIDTAVEAYNKAYEVSPKSQAKVRKGLEVIANYAIQMGNIYLELGKFGDGAASFETAFNVQSAPAYNEPQSNLIYYAGYMYTIEGGQNPAAYTKGVDALKRALEAGYAETELNNAEIADAEKGNVFYYLFHCYYGLKDADAANLQSAKSVLLEGIKMFPKNTKILEGLMQLYTSEDKVGDPQELVSLIDEAIAADPKNADLWFGRGRVYFALKNYDECIASFAKVTELAPDVFDGYYYLGLFYTLKGDEMLDATNDKSYTSQSEYNADLDAAYAVYADAIPCFEKALEIKSEDFSTAEYLKSICYRLRDMEGISAKYDKYNAIYQVLKDKQ